MQRRADNIMHLARYCARFFCSVHIMGQGRWISASRIHVYKPIQLLKQPLQGQFGSNQGLEVVRFLLWVPSWKYIRKEKAGMQWQPHVLRWDMTGSERRGHRAGWMHTHCPLCFSTSDTSYLILAPQTVSTKRRLKKFQNTSSSPQRV